MDQEWVIMKVYVSRLCHDGVNIIIIIIIIMFVKG